MNGLKTAMLLGLLSALLMVGGGAMAGRNGMIMGLGLAVVLNFFSYFFSEKMALSMYRAQPLTAETAPQLYARVFPMVQNLTERMRLPMPRLWVIPDPSPNAFATGRNPEHASVAITEGLLRLMNDRELEGVIAHELGHVKHRDILISSVAATIAAALTFISRMAFFGGGRSDDEDSNPYAGLIMMIVAPIAAMLIQMAISRQREYAADAAAARYTGSPDGLISGLRKLERGAEQIPMDASPATAHMFIFPPMLGGLGRLFSTHPSMEDRIANLESCRGQVA